MYKIFNTKTKQIVATGLTLNQAHAMVRDGRGLVYLPD